MRMLSAFARAAVGGSLLVLLSLVTSVTHGGEAAQPAGSRPNVLFVAIDDLNDWIGFLGGHPDAKTPNLDRLAQRSVKFTRAYCAAPACNPSRAALLSGLRPSTTGVYLNSQPWRPAMPNAITLPEHFKAGGYHVAGGGKIFHGGTNDPKCWHEYFDQRKDPEPDNRPVNGLANTAHFDWGPLNVADNAMSDYQVVSWAQKFLENKQEKPFFLAVGLYKPHLPWYVPKEYFEKFPLGSIKLPQVKEDDLADVPEAGRKMARPEGDHRRVLESKNWEKAVQGYLAAIAFTDAQIGRLLDALDKSPYADNTIIVLWGDHGWHLGEKQHWRKFALWEEATRVPLLISLPGQSTAQECPRPVNLVDLYPTLIELCNLAPKQLDGVSLVPLLKNPQAEWDQVSLTTHGRNNHAVRSERWRYIRYADGSEELYDHQQDPMEWTNLAGDPQYNEIKASIAKRLPEINAPDAPTKPQAGGGGNRNRNRNRNRANNNAQP